MRWRLPALRRARSVFTRRRASDCWLAMRVIAFDVTQRTTAEGSMLDTPPWSLNCFSIFSRDTSQSSASWSRGLTVRWVFLAADF